MSDKSEQAQSADKNSDRVAREGYVSGTFFARWMHPDQDIRTLVTVMLSPPLLAESSLRDFFDGFITGAEAERRRRSNDHDSALPFAVEWREGVEIGWGDTEWAVGPQPGPWQPHRPGR